MTMTTPRSRNRSTPVFTIVALLVAFGMFSGAPARAADRTDGRQTTSGIIAILIGAAASPSTGFMEYTDDNPCVANGVELSRRSISDGTSNTVAFADGVLPVSDAFRPDSLRVGRIRGPLDFSIDVGGSEAATADMPVARSSRLEEHPRVVFQDGDELFVHVFDGVSFRLLARKTIPPGASVVTMTDVLISSFQWTPAKPGSAWCVGFVP